MDTFLAVDEDTVLEELYGLRIAGTNPSLLDTLYTVEVELQMSFAFTNSDLIVTIRNAIRMLIMGGAECIGFGTTRICFAYPESNSVIKIPFNMIGYEASFSESEAYKRFKKAPETSLPIANCRFMDFRDTLGMQLLVMERLVSFPPKSAWRTGDLPRWTDEIDCGQVGWNAAGELVAYDL